MAVRVVVKVGGEVLEEPYLSELCESVRAVLSSGLGLVMVHGGGAQATALSKRLGLSPKIFGGRRVTDRETLEVMKYCVAGQVNFDLVGALNAHGVSAVGLHGASAGAIRAVKRAPRRVSGGGDEKIDFGHVGDVTGFNTALFEMLTLGGYLPVIACLAAGERGEGYNINADVVASQLAVNLGAFALCAVTPVGAVRRELHDPGSRIEKLTAREAREAIKEGVIAGGMIPKVEEALGAIERGVGRVYITSPGELAAALSSEASVGTVLIA